MWRRNGNTVGLMFVNREPVSVAALAMLSRFLWRRRSALAPVTVGMAVFVVSGIGHARYPNAWTPLIVVTGVLGIVMGFPHRVLKANAVTTRLSPVSERMCEAFGMDRPIERAYGAIVVSVTGIWSAVATKIGPFRRPLPKILVAGVIVCGIPWWIHRRRRARVRVERITEDWPTLAESMGLPGSRIASAVVDAWGFTARVILKKGSTVGDAVNRIPAIESGLGVRSGSVRILPDAKRADRCIMRVVEKDPHSEPLNWPAPSDASIHRPVILGLFEDAREVAVSFLRRHILIGGVVGSGKSGVVNVILGVLTSCRDVAVWGIDLKEGMELAPWKPCLGRLATNGTTASALLRDGVAELERRARILTAQGRRVWEPSHGNPALVIVIDEYAELSDDAREFADSIARRGRAVAVTLIAATQRPTQATMGGATRTQMDIRICLRVRERRDADLILGQGYAKSGWNAESLTLPGGFLISGPEHQSPERARAYLVTDDAVSRHVADNAGQQPGAATPPDMPSGPSYGSQAVGGVKPGTGVQQGPEGPSGAHVEPDAALLAALRSAGAKGASVDGLMSASGMGRSWVYLRLRTHADAGRAEQISRGRWRAADNEQQARQAQAPKGPTRTRRARRERPPNRDAR